MALRIFICAFLWLSILGSSSWANEFEQQCDRFVGFSNWRTDEEQLLRDLRDGQLNDHTLVQAALIVSGYDTGQVSSINSTFLESCKRCRSMMKVRSAKKTAQVQQLFEYLVSNHLYGNYTPDLCDIGKTISHGEFNCLTGTILFRALCKEFDIEVQAAWEPSHVRCWIPIVAGTGYLVETTADNPAAGVSELLPMSKLSERKLSPEQLLGKVFYNRGVRALENDQFSLALTSTWASCLLDLDDMPAQNNLRACLNNWALWASQRNDNKLAIRLLDAGLQLDPNYEPFSRNRGLLLSHD